MKGILTLIKMNQRALDNLRRQLVQFEEQKEQLIQLAARLYEELMKERELAAQDPLSGTYMARFEKRMQERQLEIAKEVVRLDGEIHTISIAIAERFSELKKYEITRDNELARQKEAEDKREQAQMDEVGIQKYQRREDEKKS